MSASPSRTGLGPVDEIHIAVRNLDAIRDFYLDVVGFEEDFYHPGEMLGLKSGAVSVAFVAAERGASGVALVLSCDDVDGTVAGLEASGIEITEKPWDGHWGGRVAAFKDPEGNKIYLEQPVTSPE